MRPRRIAVDWDSTLATEVWPGIGDWLPGAVDALKRLAEMYDEVVIFTLRVSPVDVDEVTPHDPYDQIVAIGKMLTEAEIPMNVYIWTKSYKPPCEFFIDDRNIAFDGDWNTALSHVGVRRALTNHKEETVERQDFEPNVPPEAPVWIDQDVNSVRDYGAGVQQPVCGCNGRCGEPTEQDDNPWRTQDGIKTYPDPARFDRNLMRQFETGATRNVDEDRLDYEGFLSPWALEAFAEYMHSNRRQADGTIRDSDNWQKGIPMDSYMKSMFRHFMDVWQLHRKDAPPLPKIDALCALLFNVQGMLHEIVKP